MFFYCQIVNGYIYLTLKQHFQNMNEGTVNISDSIKILLHEIIAGFPVMILITAESRYNVTQGTGEKSRYFENHVKSRMSTLSHYAILLVVFLDMYAFLTFPTQQMA